MGGKGGGQVVGYRYYAGLQVVIGNRIEKFLALRPDDRKWIAIKAESNQSVIIDEPNLFGGDKGEGGFYGIIDVHLGADGQPQNPYLAEQDSPIVSAYPNLSYLVYRGLDKGFHFVSMSGMLKEVLYYVKRINIKNNGEEQWFKEKAEIDNRFYSNEVIQNFSATLEISCKGFSTGLSNSFGNWKKEDALIEVANFTSLNENGGFFGETRWGDQEANGSTVAFASISYDDLAVHKAKVTFVVDVTADYQTFMPSVSFTADEVIEVSTTQEISGGAYKRITSEVIFVGTDVGVNITVDEHIIFVNSVPQTQYSNRIGLIEVFSYYPQPYSPSDEGSDINPIHKIREILTDYTAMNKPESDVNDANFAAAADRIFDEGLGISWAIQQKSCKEAIDEILYHIEGGIRVNRQTGKYEVVLFRDDLLYLDTAQSFNESNIKSFNPEISTSEDLINVLNVKFYDRANIKESSFNVYENGNIRTTDQEIAEDVNFPYFMNRRNAELVANWKLKQLSTPVWKGTFTTGKYDARKLNRYDVIKLSWSNLGIVNLPVRVMKISLGDGVDNTVSIDFVEVVPYSSIDYQPINVDTPTSVILPTQPNNSIAFEMPYFEGVQLLGQTQLDAELANNPDIGFLQVATKKPQNNSLNALLYADDSTGYERENVVNYCPFAQLDQNIGYLDTSFALKNIDSISSVSVGSVLMIGDEIMIYQSYNPTTKVITVKRGALDTVPHLHSTDAALFFYDEYPAYSTTQYVDSEVINAKVLTTTPSGVQNIGDATALPVEFNARMIRPYPPANVKLNDVYYIETIIVSNDVVVTWVDRNRLQQTGGAILGWTDEAVTREAGVTYSIELSSNGSVIQLETGITTNTYTFAKSLLIPNEAHKLRLWSVRDSYESYQIFEHSFFGEAVSLILSATAFNNRVEGSTLPDANISVVVDETFTARMRADGTSISGLAQPGSTITIEVDDL